MEVCRAHGWSAMRTNWMTIESYWTMAPIAFNIDERDF